MRGIGRISSDRSEAAFGGLTGIFEHGSRPGNRVETRENLDFGSLLDRQYRDQSATEFPILMRRLDEIGRTLVDTWHMDVFEDYRLQLAVILKRISASGHVLKTLPGHVQLVDIVDTELELIYQQVLSGQARKLEILERVDKIRALLVDAMM